MTDIITERQRHTASEASPQQIRSDRRRLMESIRAHRHLLRERPAFELAERRRLHREARERDSAERRHGKALQRIHERRSRAEASIGRQLARLDGNRAQRERRALAALRRESMERELPQDERRGIDETVDTERNRLRYAREDARRAAEAAHADAVCDHAERLEELAAREREAAARAQRRRAEFDDVAERLLALQAELAAHIDRYGELDLRHRRAQRRALRPAPAAFGRRAPEPANPAPAATPAPTSGQAYGVRAGLGWLVPIVFLGLTASLGVGDADAAAPLWVRIATRLVAVAIVVELFRLWVPRRRWRTAGPMPAGTAPLAAGAFFALLAAGVFADLDEDGGPAWAAAVVALVLLLGGVARRAGRRRAAADPV